MGKQKIREWLEKQPTLWLEVASKADIIHQYIQEQSGWVSVESDHPKNDDGPYWVLFPCGSVQLMRLNPYTLYGGEKDFWQDYAGNDRFMNHTHYIKINQPLPPIERNKI